MFKRPRIGYPMTALDVKGVNDFFQGTMFTLYGNIDYTNFNKKVRAELKSTYASIEVLENEIVSKVDGPDGSTTMSLRPGAVQIGFNDISDQVTITPLGMSIANGTFSAPSIVGGTITGGTIIGGTIIGEEFIVEAHIGLKPPFGDFGIGAGELRFYRSNISYDVMKIGADPIGYSSWLGINNGFRVKGTLSCTMIQCDVPPWATPSWVSSNFAYLGHYHSEFDGIGTNLNTLNSQVYDLMSRVSNLESA